jgi:hypothetical protein
VELRPAFVEASKWRNCIQIGNVTKTLPDQISLLLLQLAFAELIKEMRNDSEREH